MSITLGDMWPTDQPTPSGYEWIKERVDSVGFQVLKDMLQSGQEPAFELSAADGVLSPVAVNDWLSPYCDLMLSSGYKSHYFSPEMPVDPATPRDVFSYGSDWRKLFVKKSIDPVTKIAAHPTPNYISPFIVFMLEAVDKFNIQPAMDRMPKKEELEDFFRNKKLPDGTPLSNKMVEMMATFCRPPEAMKGGNKK